ncbi:MAG: oligosaccharide flippase family protein [Clostridia bacterium]|nr:oligosaccharide flippase family protein [Clostridia bacterium]
MISSSKQIKFGAILSYTSIILSVVAGLLYTPWMVDQIGQSSYGLYTLANSIISLFLIDFGLSSAVSRYLAKYNAEGKQEQAEQFLGAVYKLYLIVDAVIFAVLFVYFFLIDSVYVGMSVSERADFKIVFLISAAFSVINFPFVTFNGILNAYEKFIPLKLIDVFYRIFSVLLTIVALLLGYGVFALVSVQAIVGLLSILFKFIAIKKSVPIRVRFGKVEKGTYKEIFSFSIWVTVATIAQRLIFNITPTILGVVATTAAIAVFGVVVTIESYAFTLTSAINGMFLPKISKIVIGEEAEKNLTPLLVSVGKFQYAISGLIIAGFAVIGKYFINIWMGPEYIGAYYGLLLVLTPGIFYNSLQIANTTVIVTKKVKTKAIVGVITAVINLALAFPLGKHFGVVGACMSICIAYMFRAVALNIIYHKILPLNMITFIKKVYVRMSIPIILTIGAGIGLNYIIADSGWLMFAVKAMIICLIYLIFTYLIGLNKQEKQSVLNKIIKKRT